MEYPMISIITVSFNAVKTIEKTIKSIVEQTYSNIEYIIIDGGSTDGTIDIIKKYENNIAYWVSEPDKGIYDAMNKGLKIANGDWCIFIGADDILYSRDTIQTASKNMLHQNKIYYGDVILTSNNNRYMGELKSLTQLYKQNICHQSIFYPKFIYKNKEYNLQHKIFADYVYNLELYKTNNFDFEYINHIITIFESSGISSDPTSYKNFQREKDKLIKQIFNSRTYYLLKLTIIGEKVIRKLHNLFK